MKTSDQIVEELLVINCQAGDRKAFELLVKRWNPKMLSRVYHTTKDANASKDIVQEAWIIIIKKIKTLRDPAAFAGWSLRIATLKGVDWIRANQLDRKREEIRETVQHDFSEKDNNPNEELLKELKSAIQQLPKDQQEVIQLFYQEKLTMVTICQLLDLPIGTVKSRLFRGREYLKRILGHKIQENEN